MKKKTFGIKFYIKFFFPILIFINNAYANNVNSINENNGVKIEKNYEEAFENWKKDFRKKALKEEISEEILKSSFDNAKLIPKVIKLDKKQPSHVINFKKYKKIFINETFLQKAKNIFSIEKEDLDEISKKYKVQPEFIVALWGVESRFGKYTGTYKIIDSLSTLTFEGRRSNFFGKELINALKIISNGDISVANMKGSWAGAMGQTQFMPSAFLSYAEDYNKDGKADIWKTKVDILASIANYLAKNRWDNDFSWGATVKLPENFDKSLMGMNIKKDISEWQEIGVRKEDGSNLLKSTKKIDASIIYPSNKQEDQEHIYMVYNNLKVLLKWNKSLYFGIIVGLISDNLI